MPTLRTSLPGRPTPAGALEYGDPVRRVYATCVVCGTVDTVEEFNLTRRQAVAQLRAGGWEWAPGGGRCSGCPVPDLFGDLFGGRS